MSIEKRVVVVSGATGGLGSFVARELAGRGASMALLDLNQARLDNLAKDLDLPATRLLARTVNLLDPSETKAAAGAVADKFGRLDILLHLVGGWTGGKPILEVPAPDLEFMLNQHVWTSFHMVQAFAPALIKNGWGRIIMITSPYADRPNAKGGPYAIGKAGQESLMLTLSQELKGTGVTANLLQAKSIDVKNEKVTSPSPENAAWTTLEEMWAAILYLLSEQAGAINGARIPLYGSY